MARKGYVTVKYQRRKDGCWYFKLKRKTPLKEGADLKKNFLRKHYFDTQYGGSDGALEACKKGRAEALATGKYVGYDKEKYDTVFGVALHSKGDRFVVQLGNKGKDSISVHRKTFSCSELKGDKPALKKALECRLEYELSKRGSSKIDLNKIDTYYDAYCKKYKDKLPWLK